MSAFQHVDMGICLRREFVHRLQRSDIPDSLEDVNGILEKGEEVRGIDIDPVFLQEILRDLAVIEAVFPEFQDLPREFLFSTAALGGIASFAAQE